MPAIRSLGKVDLLPADEFETSIVGRGLKWALTAGRVLVVLTEFVVILAFASRFYFDKKLNDLNDVVDQKKQLVQSYADIENQMRDVLTRQAPIKKYISRQVTPLQIMSELDRKIPAGSVLTDFYADESTVSISGQSESEYGLVRMLTAMRSITRIKNLNLDEVSYDQKLRKVVFKMSGSLETYAKR